MAPAATLKLLHIDLEVLTTQIANEREALSPKKVLHRIARSSASSSTKYGLTHFEDLVYEDLCLVRTSREDLFSSLGITRSRLDRRVPAASAHAELD